MSKPRHHAAASLALAAVIVARSRRWRDAIPVLIAGVLVDLDHIVDLTVFRLRGKEEVHHTFLPLHAWELVLALLTRGTRSARGAAGGLAVHLAMDGAFNRAVAHPLFYWLSVRAWYRFRATAPLVHEERYQREAVWMLKHPREWI